MPGAHRFRLPCLFSSFLSICFVCALPSHAVPEASGGASIGEASCSSLQGGVMKAGIFEYAIAVSDSAGRIFTGSWIEQNKIAVAFFGVFLLVMMFIVFRL